VRYVDELRDPALVRALVERVARAMTRPWSIMEVCGGQTHTIVRHGLDQLLPEGLELIHGPGCPVCVTPAAVLDRAVALAARPEVVLTTFGDMLRVPGTSSDLASARARGGDVRVLYSPLDAVALAEERPDKQIVVLAVGFETTAPATAMVLLEAERRGLDNLSALVAHVRVPPALVALLSGPERAKVDGLLAAGHVCTVMGLSEYEPLVGRLGVPIVVTGFEPVDLLGGIAACVDELEAGRVRLVNQYERAVRSEGNVAARQAVERVFEVISQEWRGLGVIADSGLGLRPRYERFDARRRFEMLETKTNDRSVVRDGGARDPGECKAGLVLAGRLKPPACPAFGAACTPERPLGAPMVSPEGACAAYYRHGRRS
jgi:hydrogenase expression/formation protein HypD